MVLVTANFGQPPTGADHVREIDSEILLVAVVVPVAADTRSESPVTEEKQSDTAGRETTPGGEATRKSFQVADWPDNSQLHNIDRDDPACKVVMSYVEEIKKRHKPKRIVYCKELKSRAAKRLFPEYRFFLLSWVGGNTYILDSLALDKHLKLTSIGYGVRYDQSFGEFLAEHNITITDEKVRAWYGTYAARFGEGIPGATELRRSRIDYGDWVYLTAPTKKATEKPTMKSA